jgi:hypothetical protein
MRTQTQTKIRNIKNAIQNGEDLKSIEKRFFNTATKKKEFLNRVYRYFSKEDLDYLGYENETEKLIAEMNAKKEKEKKDITNITDSNTQENYDITNITSSNTDETNNITNITDNINNESKDITDITKKYTEFFKDINNVNALFEMVQKYRNTKENNIELLESGELSIPLEARSIKSDTNISLKANSEQYEILKQIAYRNRIGIGQLINFIFWEFIKRHS